MALAFIITGFFVLPCIACYKVAEHKHLDKHFWTAMAACFGPFPLLLLLFIAAKNIPPPPHH